jgi:hypothetical protein
MAVLQIIQNDFCFYRKNTSMIDRFLKEKKSNIALKDTVICPGSFSFSQLEELDWAFRYHGNLG